MADDSNHDLRSLLLRRTAAMAKMRSPYISASELEQARREYDNATAEANPLRAPISESQPIYVAIERAVVLGGAYKAEGTVYIVESDGRLKPIDGRELTALDSTYPNFVKGWRPKDWSSLCCFAVSSRSACRYPPPISCGGSFGNLPSRRSPTVTTWSRRNLPNGVSRKPADAASAFMGPVGSLKVALSRAPQRRVARQRHSGGRFRPL
jgi:hypothetical protein